MIAVKLVKKKGLSTTLSTSSGDHSRDSRSVRLQLKFELKENVVRKLVES